jgi:hypothetical protein
MAWPADSRGAPRAFWGDGPQSSLVVAHKATRQCFSIQLDKGAR